MPTVAGRKRTEVDEHGADLASSLRRGAAQRGQAAGSSGIALARTTFA
jgi:hypothetical protein